MALPELLEASQGQQVVGRRVQHVLELGLGFPVLAERHERASERNARGQVRRVMREPGAAHIHRLLVIAAAPELFGKLRKCNRRRVLKDPASKFLEAGVVCRHALNCTA